MNKIKINEYSTDETISEMFFEDGYDELNFQYADHAMSLDSFEDFCHIVRKNAETGCLVWTERHIVGTRSPYQFSIAK